MTKTIHLKLIETPTAHLRMDGEMLGTDRLRVPITTQPVLLPSLVNGLEERGYNVDAEIINMKLGERHERSKGSIDLQGLDIENLVLGAPFDSMDYSLREADVIGLTSNFTYSSRVVRDFIEYAKRINPNLKILVGGADASARQEYYLDAGADVVIRGEGELNGPSAIDALVRGEELEGVERIAFKKNGQVVRTQQSLKGNQVDMNSLPLPSLDGIDLQEYTDTGEGPLVDGASSPIFAFETSRGCKQACHFCTTPFLKPGFRAMSLERIAEYFEHIKKSGVRTMLSYEDNPLSRMQAGKGYQRDIEGREEVLKYAELIGNTGLAFEWANGLEIGKLANEHGEPDTELINALFQHRRNPDGTFSGTYRCYVPLEALSDEGISSLRKLRTYDVEKRILEAIVDTKVPMLNLGVIVGMADESMDGLNKTKERCYELKRVVKGISPDTKVYYNFFTYTPLPGTPDIKRDQNRLIGNIDSQPELWNFYLGTIDGDNISAREMTLLRREISKEVNEGAPAMQVYN